MSTTATRIPRGYGLAARRRASACRRAPRGGCRPRGRPWRRGPSWWPSRCGGRRAGWASRSSGWSGGSGSGSVTSRPAPARRPSRSAVGERVLVDDRAARGVDEDRRGLHARQRVGVDEVARLGRQRGVDRDEVRALERGCRSSPRSTISTSISNPDGALGHGLADAPGADDGERGAVDVGADPALRLPRAPLAVARVLAGLDDAAGDREHERPGEVGGRVGEHVGRVADLDVAGRRRLEVDVVEADRVVGHRAQLRGGVQQLRVDLVDEHRQQPLGLRDAAPAGPRAAAACRPARPRCRARRRGARGASPGIGG